MLFWNKCPKCKNHFPIIRPAKTLHEAFSGERTCQNCGAKINLWGEEITEENKAVKSQPLKRLIFRMFYISLAVFIVLVLFVGILPSSQPSQKVPAVPSIGTTETTGALNISAEGDLYLSPGINGANYLGRNNKLIDLTVGNYVLESYAPSTNELCWRRTFTILAGKTILIRDNTYCR